MSERGEAGIYGDLKSAVSELRAGVRALGETVGALAKAVTEHVAWAHKDSADTRALIAAGYKTPWSPILAAAGVGVAMMGLCVGGLTTIGGVVWRQQSDLITNLHGDMKERDDALDMWLQREMRDRDEVAAQHAAIGSHPGTETFIRWAIPSITANHERIRALERSVFHANGEGALPTLPADGAKTP